MWASLLSDDEDLPLESALPYRTRDIGRYASGPVSPHLHISADHDRIRSNALALRGQLAPAGVELYAVVKANGYGFGCRSVAETLAPVVDAFYLFELAEAIEAKLSDFGKRILALDHPWQGAAEADYLAAGVTPVVYSPARASLLRRCQPVLAVDTGMLRFGCPPEQVAEAVRAGEIREAMTHASRPEQVALLKDVTAGRGLKLHAAATHLLGDPTCWLNAVRPGLALYRGALTVRTSLVECRPTKGAAGYTRFAAPYVGVIPVGYAAGLRLGPCLVGGTPCRIREVGMQTAFVEVGPSAKVGDDVTLLGDGITEAQLAEAWGVSQQEVMVRFWGSRK